MKCPLKRKGTSAKDSKQVKENTAEAVKQNFKNM